MQVDKNCNATTQVQTNVTPPLVTATNNQNQSESHKLNAQQLAYSKQATDIKGGIVTTPIGKVFKSFIFTTFYKLFVCVSFFAIFHIYPQFFCFLIIYLENFLIFLFLKQKKKIK